MTIVVGIKATNGIVIACDSRTTEPSGHINDNAVKLHTVRFASGNPVIVAEAGNAEFASRAIEIMQEFSKKQMQTDYRTAADCAEHAVAEVKQHVRKQFHGTAEELQRHFEQYHFELMVAYYWEKTPHIFTISFETGIAVKKDAVFCTMGCGWLLANFILLDMDLARFNFLDALWTAVYIVEEIKKIDSRCGGRTAAAFIDCGQNNSECHIVTHAKIMEELVPEVLEYSKSFKTKWQETLNKRIDDYHARTRPQQRQSS